MNKAFIFTMDAVLALIPIFIITAGISQIGGTDTLASHGFLLGAEKMAHGTLEVMSVRKDTERTNSTMINLTLQELIPDYYKYHYELEYNGSSIVNVSSGNYSLARDVVVARRLDYVKLYALLGVVWAVSHGGSPVSVEKCPRNGNKPPIYESYFTVEIGELSTFDYWIEGQALESGVRAWYYLTNESKDCSDLQGGGIYTQFMDAGDFSAKVQVDSELQEGVTNYLYLKIAANPQKNSNYYLIKAPMDTDSTVITYENAVKRTFAWATLRVWS
ncbi:MAG: hypothetical protein V3R86_03660 [Candidatus Hydrothermarchaeaceae archaeon]